MPLTFARVEKPPYRVPSMKEIAEREPNGLSFVSTFSGCGGSCLGFKMAGWRPLMASEFVPAAQETYLLNNPEVPMMLDDIREVDPNVLLEYLGLDVGELDLLEGSPPCASFSTAGKRHAGWGESKKYSDTEQRADDLFFEYTRLLGALQPRAFVAENVTGLVKGTAVGYFKLIVKALEECGYVVRPQVLDASRLGVPQARQRVIFVGMRNDLGLDPPDVKALKYREYQYTVRDAIPLALRHGTAPPHADWHAAGHDPFHDAVAVDSGKFPAPTIVASGENKGAGWVEIRTPVAVIHDTSGAWSIGDVSDQPCPTITVGVDSLNSVHYQVEESVVRIPVRVAREARADAGDAEFVVPAELWDRAVAEAAETGKDVTVQLSDIGFVGANAEQHAQESAPGGAADITRYQTGLEWDKLKPGEQSERYFSLIRPDPDKPSPTVTAATAFSAGAASVTHPTERRKFTIAELKRISGFPDDFVLSGNYRQQWERIGRAVPPVMMCAVAEAVADTLLA